MSKDTKNEGVDFSNPESLAAELAAATPADATPGTPKEKKPAKPRVLHITIVADKDYKVGDEITFDYEVPKGDGIRGQLTGVALEEMTDDQLKIEYRNANSVAYKTKKAGHDTTKADARLEACKAEMEKRGIQPTSRGSAPVDATTVAQLIIGGKLSVEDIQKLLDEAAKATAAQ